MSMIWRSRRLRCSGEGLGTVGSSLERCWKFSTSPGRMQGVDAKFVALACGGQEVNRAKDCPRYSDCFRTAGWHGHPREGVLAWPWRTTKDHGLASTLGRATRADSVHAVHAHVT